MLNELVIGSGQTSAAYRRMLAGYQVEAELVARSRSNNLLLCCQFSDLFMLDSERVCLEGPIAEGVIRALGVPFKLRCSSVSCGETCISVPE